VVTGFRPKKLGQPLTSLHEPGLQQGLSRLFGEGLIGAWPELEARLAEPKPLRGPRLWTKPVLVLLGLALGAVAVARFTAPGIEKKTAVDTGRYAEELSLALTDGDLKRVARYLVVLEQRPRELPRHAPLVLAAQATLFRYADAEPVRLQRMSPLMQSEPTHPKTRLAALTLAPREERALAVVELERLVEQLPRDPEAAYLLATARAFRGEHELAAQAFARSAALGPGWLAHRFEEAEYHRARGEEELVEETVREMLRSAPLSPFTRLAVAVFGRPAAVPGEAPLPSPSAEAPEESPAVVGAREAEFAAVTAEGRGEGARATEELARAVRLVQGHRAFLLDAFDRLLEGGSRRLARVLTEQSSWPASEPLAARRSRELRASVKEAPSSPVGAQGSPEPERQVR